MRIRIDINYRGTDYSGWQRQANGLSVQQVIEDTLHSATGAKTVIHGAGRTDAGVHAHCMTAHFDTAATIPADKFAAVLNNLLPPDISVIKSREVDRGFHSQFSCKSRTYEYKILVTPVRFGLYHDTHWQVRDTLRVDLMEETAKLLLGTHDFKAFSTAGSTATTTVRTISKLEIVVSDQCASLRDTKQSGYGNAECRMQNAEQDNNIIPLKNSPPAEGCPRNEGGAASLNSKLQTLNSITITVQADGFLYNMVRVIAAQLVKAGKGLITPSAVLAALKSGKRHNCRECAPAYGLYFVEAEY